MPLLYGFCVFVVVIIIIIIIIKMFLKTITITCNVLSALLHKFKIINDCTLCCVVSNL